MHPVVLAAVHCDFANVPCLSANCVFGAPSLKAYNYISIRIALALNKSFYHKVATRNLLGLSETVSATHYTRPVNESCRICTAQRRAPSRFSPNTTNISWSLLDKQIQKINLLPRDQQLVFLYHEGILLFLLNRQRWHQPKVLLIPAMSG